MSKGVEDLQLVLKDLRKRHESSAEDKSTHVSHHFKQATLADRQQIPLPQNFQNLAEAQDEIAPLAKAVLAKVSDRMISFTGKVNLRGRGVTPSIALILLKRLEEIEGTVREVDVSSNPLKTEGLAEVCLGLVGKKELARVVASECGVELQRVDDGLTAKQLLNAGPAELAACDSRIDETAKKLEHAFLAMVKDVPALNTIDLSKNGLDYFGVRMLHHGLLLDPGAGLASSLVELRLAHGQLRTEKACKSLQMVLGALGSLKTLDLSYNSIRGAGAKAVAEGLKACESLEDVNLSNNGFGDPEPAKVLGVLLSGVKWGVRNRPGKEMCPCRVRRLDVSYNRFTLERQGEWPAKAAPLTWVVALLPDLLPLLNRFEGDVDPCALAQVSLAGRRVRGRALEAGELLRLRSLVETLRPMLDTELRMGRFKGSAITMLGGLSAESNGALEWIDMGGHVMSEDGHGVLAHIVGRLQRESSCPLQSHALKVVSSDQPELESARVLQIRGPRWPGFPRSARTVNGFQVWEVSSSEQHMMADVEARETLESCSAVTVTHTCEVAFSGRPEQLVHATPTRKPRGPAPFLPQEQLDLEQVLAERIRHRHALLPESARDVQAEHSPGRGASPTGAQVEAEGSGEQMAGVAKGEPSMLTVFSMASTEAAAAEKSLLFSEPSLREPSAPSLREPSLQTIGDEEEQDTLPHPDQPMPHPDQAALDHSRPEPQESDAPAAPVLSIDADSGPEDSEFASAVVSFQSAIAGWREEWKASRPSAKPKPATKTKKREGASPAPPVVDEPKTSLLAAKLRKGPLLLIKYGLKLGQALEEASSPVKSVAPSPAPSAARSDTASRLSSLQAEASPSRQGSGSGEHASASRSSSGETHLPALRPRMLGEQDRGAAGKGSTFNLSQRSLKPQASSSGLLGAVIGESAETMHALAAAKLQSAFSANKKQPALAQIRSPAARIAKNAGGEGLWSVLRRKQHIGTSRSDMTQVADPMGSDLHFHCNPDLPTFACPVRIEVGGARRGKFGVLVRVEGEGQYVEPPNFFRGRGLPSAEQELQSLHFEGDTIRLATVAAEHREDAAFWSAISSIRQSWPSERDADVSATLSCPSLLVIGEPFYFTYLYAGAESRLPDAFKSDWIGLYKISGEGEGEEQDEDDVKGSGLLIARFRPPHGASAELQLRHVLWEPGQYQLRLTPYNSDRCIGTSNVCLVKYASANLTCPDEVIIEEGAFEVTVITDYTSMLHPTTDWLGVFPKNSTYVTARHAAKIFPAPEKNVGKVTVDTAGLEGEYEIFYFQELAGGSRVMGQCETHMVPKPPKPPDKFVKAPKSASEKRHVTFYLSGTFEDFERERELLYSKVVPGLRQVCDARRLSVSFMDLRCGVGSDIEEITAHLHKDSDETLIDRCLVELERCVPYFLCLLGHVYGKVPDAVPRRTGHLYPWLADRRYQNVGVTHGARLSLTEMEIVNTILVDTSVAPHARFYLRDQSYTVGRGITFADPEEWAKIAMSTLKARIKRAVEASARLDPVRCMKMHSYYHPSSFADRCLKDIVGILDMDYRQSDLISELQLFWTTMDAVSNQHRAHMDNQIPREIEKMDELCHIVDAQFFIDPASQPQGKKIVLTGPSGSGKSAALVRWVQQVGKRAKREGDKGSWRQNCIWMKDGGGEGRDLLLAVFFCGMHQRLRHPCDLLRAIMETLAESFDFQLKDEEMLDEHVLGIATATIQALGRNTSLLIVIDGIESFSDGPAVEWLPVTAQKGVHWLLSTSDERQIADLIKTRGFMRIDVDELIEEQREGLVQSMIKRHKPEVFREQVEVIKAAQLAARPDFLIASMDVMRMCKVVDESDALASWASEFQDMDSLYIAVLRQWCDNVKGLRDMLYYLCLTETGLYEHELMQLLQVPYRLSCVHWLDLIKTMKEATFVFCGVHSMFNQSVARLFRQRVMTEELRLSRLRDMERFFGGMPTCNRKIAEYPFVLEKLHDWNGMYMYITDIPIFRIMYSDPIRKQQFLHYIATLGKSSEEVQRTLRTKFENHFKVSRRWFCDAFSQLCGGPVLYYELNPKIYRSDRDLLYFDDVVYYVSSFFELHGEHEESLRDLEASLKALYGTSDIFQIPRLHSHVCRFPARVSRLLRRLCQLYALHLRALVEHWIAKGDDGLPKHEVPDYMDGVNVSWWTTPVPEGGARTLPMKLKLVYLIARMIADDPTMDNEDVREVLESEEAHRHLSALNWNSGLKTFVPAPSADLSLLDPVARARAYGRSQRDPETLQSVPGRINYPHAIPRRRTKRQSEPSLLGPPHPDAHLDDQLEGDLGRRTSLH